MTVEELIKAYLPSKNIMQLATSVDDQPWLCTVHYFSDDDLNIYWISTKERKHSIDIHKNPNVAGYVLVHENTPVEAWVIGLAFEGKVEYVGEELDEEICTGYIKKLNKDLNLMAGIKNGTNAHKFYRLIPTKFVLFDNKKFPDEPRQEWMPVASN